MIQKFFEIVNGKQQTDHDIEDQFYYEFEAAELEIVFLADIGDEDKHRWYSLQEKVYAVKHAEDIWYVKGDMIEQLYSESSSYDDIVHEYNFKQVFPKEIVETKTVYVDSI